MVPLKIIFSYLLFSWKYAAETENDNDYDNVTLDEEDPGSGRTTLDNSNSDVNTNPYYGQDDDDLVGFNSQTSNLRRNDPPYETITATKNIYYEL